MKKVIALFLFSSLAFIFDSKATTDICPGSGVHCATSKGEVNMNGIKITYDVVVYKAKDKPAAQQ